MLYEDTNSVIAALKALPAKDQTIVSTFVAEALAKKLEQVQKGESTYSEIVYLRDSMHTAFYDAREGGNKAGEVEAALMFHGAENLLNLCIARAETERAAAIVQQRIINKLV